MENILLICAVINLGFAGLIFYKSKNNPINYFFGLSTFSAFLWQVGLLIDLYYPFKNIAFSFAYSGSTFAPWLLFIFVSNYPQKKFKFSKFQYLLLGLPSFIFALVFIFFPKYIFLVSRGTKTIGIYGPIFPYYMAYMLIFFILIILILHNNLKIYKGIDKLKSQYFLWGIGISFFFVLLFNIIFPVFGFSDLNRLGPTFTLFLVGITSYAIVKHRLMEIEVIIRKSIFYGLLITSVFAIFTSLIFFLGKILADFLQINQIFTIMTASAIIAIFYPYLRNVIDNYTDKLFFKKQYNYQHTLKELSENLSKLINLDNIFEILVFSLPNTIKINKAQIFYLENKQFYSSKHCYPDNKSEIKKIFSDNPLIKYLAKNPKLLIKEELIFEIRETKKYTKKELEQILAELNRLDMSICMPLFKAKNLMGLFFLGKKLSDELYSIEDINLLETIAHNSNTAIQNSIHYASLEKHINNLTYLSEFTKNINRYLDIKKIFIHTSIFLNKLFGFEKQLIMLFQPEKNTLYPFFEYRINLEKADLYKKFLLGRQNSFISMNEIKILQIKNLSFDKEKEIINFFDTLENKYNFKNSLFIPLIYNQNLLGVIIISADNSFEDIFENKQSLITTIVQETAAALNNALLFTQVLEIKNFSDEILQSMVSGVITLDMSLNINSFNLAAERLTGILAKNINGKPVSNFYSICPNFNLFEKTLLQKKPLTIETMIKTSKSTLPVSISTDFMRDENKNIIGLIGVISDLSELKELQNQVEQANKLSSIGTMAAGIAHEIKNPLAAIKSFSDMVPRMWEDAHFREKYITIVGPEINRINQLCQVLLRLGRAKKQNFTTVDIKTSINDVLILLEAERKNYNAEIITDLNDDLSIIGDANQIIQVLLNLLINAFHALPKDKGGKIFISSKLTNSGYICLNIADTGIGITKDKIDKLFDPFFSTKEHGTGLGLTIVYKIIEEHKGNIKVYSEINKGTTFSIYLPTGLADSEKLTEEQKGNCQRASIRGIKT